MTDDRIIELAKQAGYDPESQTLPPFDGFIRRFAELVETEVRERGNVQARLDAVMLEFCPDEMTDEQLAAWGEAQEKVPDGRVEALTQEARNDNSHD